MTSYQIDGIDLDPQNTEHHWRDYPRRLGSDADGGPFFAKYNTLILRCPITISRHFWFDLLDMTSFTTLHTVRCPSPGTTDNWTVYSDVIIDDVKEGVVLRHSGMRGVEITITSVEV